MKQKKQRAPLTTTLLSTVIILSMIGTNVAHACMPPPRPGGAARPPVVNQPAAAAPTDVPPPPLTRVGTDSDQPTLGRLLFAPAVDTDGDPATNPVPGKAVPIVRLVTIRAGSVALAVQLVPGGSKASAFHVPVSFRVWRGEELLSERSAESDAWGAASVEVRVADIDGTFRYQASAPGFGTTEMRSFRFDPERVTYTLHADQARLQHEQAADWTVTFTLTSPQPLQADRDEVRLKLVRRPQGLGQAPEPALQPILDQIKADGLYLPFPDVKMEIVDAYTARLDIQLPYGEYRVQADLMVYGAAMHQYLTEPFDLRSRAAVPLRLDHDAIWVASLEHEAGQRLVRYTAPTGKAVFALVPAGDTPDLRFAWEENTTILKSWRTAPFEWIHQRYEVDVLPGGAQDPVPFSLQGFDYDPILRCYTVDLLRLQAEKSREAVYFEVLGPGQTRDVGGQRQAFAGGNADRFLEAGGVLGEAGKHAGREDCHVMVVLLGHRAGVRARPAVRTRKAN